MFQKSIRRGNCLISALVMSSESLKLTLNVVGIYFYIFIINTEPNWNGDGIAQLHKRDGNLHRLPFPHPWRGIWPFDTNMMHTLISGMPCTCTHAHLFRWLIAGSSGIISVSIGCKCQLKIALQLVCRM